MVTLHIPQERVTYCLNCPIRKASDLSAIVKALPLYFLFEWLTKKKGQSQRLKVKDETAYSLYLAQFTNASRSQKTQGLGSTD